MLVGFLSAANLVAQTEPPLPEAPFPVLGSCPLPTGVCSLCVDGGYAYGKGYDGLDIVDVRDPGNPTPVFQYAPGSRVKAFTKAGPFGYASISSHVEIIDFSQPDHPVFVGQYEAGSTCYGIAVVGDYAYVGTLHNLGVLNGGVHIVDIRNPLAPVQVGSFLTGETVYELKAVAGLLYVIPKQQRLDIYDITDPVQPQLLGGFHEEGDPRYSAVNVFGQLAYLRRCTTGFTTIVDVTDPAQPAAVGIINIDASWSYLDVGNSLAMAAPYAYLGGTSSGLTVLDVSNPANPVPIAVRRNSGSNVQVHDGLLYVAGRTLVILELPSDPLVLSEQPHSHRVGAGQSAMLRAAAFGVPPVDYQWFEGESGDTSRPVAGAVAGTLILPAIWKDTSYWARASNAEATRDSQTATINVAPPVQIRKVGEWPGYGRGGWNTRYQMKGCDVAIDNDLAYMTSAGLHVMDVSNPNELVRLSGLETRGYANNVAVRGSLVVVSSTLDGMAYLETVDVTDPLQPERLACFEAGGRPEGGDAEALCLNESYAYLARREYNSSLGKQLRFLDVMDLSQPGEPVRVKEVFLGFYDRLSNGHWYRNISAMRLQGDNLYIAAEDRLLVYDVSTPEAPTFAGAGIVSLPYGPCSTALCVSGGTAYMGTTRKHDDGGSKENDLVVFDLSHAASPVHIATYRTRGAVGGIAVAEDYVILGLNDLSVRSCWNLEILDVSDPAQPFPAAPYLPGSLGPILDLELIGNHLYAGDLHGGLKILGLDNPTQPTVLGEHDICSTSLKVCAAGDYAYVINTSRDLDVLDLSDPSQPRRVGNYVHHLLVTDAEGAGERLYLVGANFRCDGEREDGLLVLDISDPVHPVWAGWYAWFDYNPSLPPRYSLSVSGDLACVWNSGFWAGNPAQSFYLSKAVIEDDSGHTLSVHNAEARGSYAYVGTAQAGLQVYDFTDMAFPVCIGGTGPGSGRFLHLVGEMAHLRGDGGELRVYDVSNPAEPALIDEGLVTAFPGWPYPMSRVSGDFIYDPGEEVRVFDVTDPVRPALVGGYDPPGIATDVRGVGNRIYVADDLAGLLVLAVNPALLMYPPTRMGETVLLRWTGGPGIVLQQTTELRAAAWQDVPGSEGSNQLEVSASGGPRFFRLKAE